MYKFDVEKYVKLHNTDHKYKKYFFEPYPTSLRLINAIYFLSTNNLEDALQKQFLVCLENDYRNLCMTIEYHLDANHLLENYIAKNLYEMIFHIDHSCKETIKCLNDQVLSDGAHYERSPMYQAAIIERLLLFSGALMNFSMKKPDQIKEILAKMLGWLELFKYKESYLHFGDSTDKVALSFDKLSHNFKLIFDKEIKAITDRSQSGFFCISNSRFKAVISDGNIKCNHNPGHSHSDCMTFNLLIDGKLFVINNGISTYEITGQRLLERSTKFHNCLTLNNKNSHNVWSSFRVAERSTTYVVENKDTISLETKFYFSNNSHKRIFKISNGSFTIEDQLSKKNYSELNFFFDSQIKKHEIKKKIDCENDYTVQNVNIPSGFNSFVNGTNMKINIVKRNLIKII